MATSSIGSSTTVNTTPANTSYPGAIDVGGGSSVPTFPSTGMPFWMTVVIAMIIIGLLFYAFKA